MRRSRWSLDTVATINGWDICRERIGAAVYWHTIATDEAGYQTAAHHFERRKDAQDFAKQNDVPPPPAPDAETLACRTTVSEIMARYHSRRNVHQWPGDSDEHRQRHHHPSGPRIARASL